MTREELQEKIDAAIPEALAVVREFAENGETKSIRSQAERMLKRAGIEQNISQEKPKPPEPVNTLILTPDQIKDFVKSMAEVAPELGDFLNDG